MSYWNKARMATDIGRTLKVGLAVATAYFGLVAVVSLLTGKPPAMFKGSIMLAALLYFGVAALASVIVGFLRPLSKSRVGGYLVGVIAAIPCVAIVVFTLRPEYDLRLKLVGSLVMGSIAGLGYTWALRD